MVRRYERVNRHTRKGVLFKPYNSYKKEDLELAKIEVNAGNLSIPKAATKYHIPRSTLSRHCNKDVNLQERAGRPTLFTKEEEEVFVRYILILSEWGFPMDRLDLRIFAQKYLKRIGRSVYSLKDNMPGRDWVLNFLDRHKTQLSNRVAANISTLRAKITSQDIDEFFERYINTVEGVSPDNIINYDETNLTDDPGAKKYIFKRGCKYSERLINSSKTAVSIMFSGTASGEMLPEYVVYKSEHLWDQWLEGGPDNCRYNRSKSGWFDSICFEDWFFSVVIPFTQKKEGRKVLIGDNLSSHFSDKVVEECEKRDILFVCLPPKATHLLQPLDVAFYAPLKHYWRVILTEWKATEGRKHTTLLKSAFPKLLKKLNDLMIEKQVTSTNIISGFEKCGLWPINPERPKTRIPTRVNTEEINVVASEIVIDMLQTMRSPLETSQNKRKKRCEVEPGQSITAKDIQKAQPKTKRNINTVTQKIKNKKIQKENSIQNSTSNTCIGIGQSGKIDIDVEICGYLSESEEEPKKEKKTELSTNQNNRGKHPSKSPTGKMEDKTRKNKEKKKAVEDSNSSNSDVEMSAHSDSDIMDIDSNVTDCSETEYKEYESDDSEVRRKVNDIESKIWNEIAEIDEKTKLEEMNRNRQDNTSKHKFKRKRIHFKK